MRSLLVFTAVLALACGGLVPAEEPPPAPVPAPPPPAPAPEPPPAPAPSDLPEAPYGSVPGWLGWAAQPDRDHARLAWTVPAGDAQVAILDAGAWSSVPQGRELRIVTKDGNVPATFAGVRSVQIGCDGGQPVDAAALKADAAIPEGPVWILPDGADATALPLTPGETDAKHAAWTLGPLLVKVRVDAGKGRLEVFRDAEVLLDRGFETSPDLPDPPDLARDVEYPGVPVPIAGFQVDAETAAIVMQVPSMEGVHWEVYALRAGSLAIAGDAYLYLCAG